VALVGSASNSLRKDLQTVAFVANRAAALTVTGVKEVLPKPMGYKLINTNRASLAPLMVQISLLSPDNQLFYGKQLQLNH